MMCNRPCSLPAIPLCLSFLALIVSVASAQQPSGQQPPAQPPSQQTRPQNQPPRTPNPFETVPVAPAEPAPEAPKTQNAPPPATVRQPRPGQPPEDVIEAIEFRG